MKTKTRQLWEKAIKIIPGGVQLYSKRPDRFLPGKWPTYYKKAKGCYVWDLEGKRYLDMSYMGIGACILGYSDPDINEAVKKAIDKGSMSTLNCPEDVELASTLIQLHPWASMVRYARTGGEAMAIAIRIARAYTDRDKIAYCGYHGWHDWYMAGGTIDSAGIPKGLKGTAIPFEYNTLPKKDNYAAIVMEVRREHEPDDGYLEKIRNLANKTKSVLIFDEVTSGFRCNVGGIHLLHKVYPDICVLGKAIANGFPMAAIIGKRKIMEACNKSFISSTFWSERIGPVAAIATIKKLKECNVPNYVSDLGLQLKDGFEELGLETENILPLIGFKLRNDYNNEDQTKFNQEMLKRGILATNHVYLSYAHKLKHIEQYLEAMQDILKKLPETKLEGLIISPGFKRLT